MGILVYMLVSTNMQNTGMYTRIIVMLTWNNLYVRQSILEGVSNMINAIFNPMGNEFLNVAFAIFGLLMVTAYCSFRIKMG